LQTIIEKPGQLAKFQFRPTNGNPLTIAILAKRIGSTISPLIKLKTESGKLLKEFRETDGLDPVISYSPTDKSPIVIEIGDQLYSGSTNHIAYIQILEKNLAETPLDSVVKAGNQTNIKWISETGDFDTVTFQSNKPDLISIEQINSPAGWLKRSDQKLISSRIPLVNSTTTEAFTPPFSASLQFQSSQPANRIRMKARKGQPLVVETYARRLGRELDSLIDIKDASGKPVQLAAFRKVTDTLVAFRDHGSRQKGIRLTQWADFQMADYVLIGREITRIFQLPRNPDDDCQFFGDELRWGYFGTTPEQHSMSQTVTKLELLAPESENTIAQNLVHRVYYSNDDGGMAVGNDSYLLFNPPADGEYVVEVRETTSRSGDGANYALVVREPKPDFELLAISTDWNIAKGGSKLITVNIRRKDGFNEPVALKLTGLPEGWQATEGFIEPDQTSCDILITPDHSNSKTYYDQMNWKLKATARISNQFISHELYAAGGSTVITPESNMAMKASTYDLKIKPGSISRMILKVDRREPFAGRVPIDVKNLPYGVRVLDIGLNGVLITEPQQEREVRIYAEPWVKAQKRPFFSVGRAESAGTADSSPPVMLEVVEDVLATRQGSDR
jgi:hypothetical protein